MPAAFSLQQVLSAGIPERLPLDLGWNGGIPFPFPIIFPVFFSASRQFFALYVCEKQYCVSLDAAQARAGFAMVLLQPHQCLLGL